MTIFRCYNRRINRKGWSERNAILEFNSIQTGKNGLYIKVYNDILLCSVVNNNNESYLSMTSRGEQNIPEESEANHCFGLTELEDSGPIETTVQNWLFDVPDSGVTFHEEDTTVNNSLGLFFDPNDSVETNLKEKDLLSQYIEDYQIFLMKMLVK